MSDALLQVTDLRRAYRSRAAGLSDLWGSGRRAIRAVDGVDLQIGRGETLALVGESGSGKTTTGRLITRQESVTGGTIRFDGADVTAVQGRSLRRFKRSVQMIFQNPYESFDPRLTIGRSLREPLTLNRIGSSTERDRRVEEVLLAVDLAPATAFISRYPSDLSGGQLQRVAIARALVLRPSLIVADEPVSMLDTSVRAGVLALMMRLQAETGLSYLLITHDLAVARYASQRTAVMYAGLVVEEGTTEALIVEAGHPYTRLLVAAVPGTRAGSARRQRIKLSAEGPLTVVDVAGCRFPSAMSGGTRRVPGGCAPSRNPGFWPKRLVSLRNRYSGRWSPANPKSPSGYLAPGGLTAK